MLNVETRWDVFGVAGLGLVAVGVFELAGLPWALILIGVVMLGLYVVRESASARRGG